jgi:caspase domain-containing protein
MRPMPAKPVCWVAILAILFISASELETVLAGTDKPPEVWLEIPELQSRVEANSFVTLPRGHVSYLQLHINKQPGEVSYGSIHTKINTEAANTIMAIRSTAEGFVCNLDLSHRGGFEIAPGRNSVEVEYSDPYQRVHYASFLLQVPLPSEGNLFGSFKARPKPSAAPPEKLSGEKYAVIVGISKYQNAGAGLTNLRYADRDARAVRDFLETPAGGGFRAENIVALFNEDATSQNLRTALFTFLTKPGPQDLVVIYFAGHGAPDPNDSRNLYLLTYDTKPDDMGGTAFPMWQLQDVFGRVLKAKHVISFNDSCHSYGISGQRLGAVRQNNLVNQYVQHYASQSERAVITASDVSELSEESEKWGGGHGVFTYYLLQGLQGEADSNKDGTVTAGELFTYLSERVSKATDGQQNPQAIPGLARNLPLSGIGLQKVSTARLR